MPRVSPFKIKLHPKEKAALEAMAKKYTSPYRDVIRAKIVLLAAQGYSNEEISARIDTPRQVVSKWRKRFYYDRLMGLQDQPRGGRPGAFSPCSDN